MKSLQYLYRIGRGPSSSHTMAPQYAAEIFKAENPDAQKYKVILYGSLAKTGKGHGTDKVLMSILGEDTEIEFDYELSELPHPNTMDLYAIKGEDKAFMRVHSVGGGALYIEGRENIIEPDIYSLNKFADIKEYCKQNHLRLCDYVYQTEGEEIRNYLATVWSVMKKAIKKGLKEKGELPGGLQVKRKARYLYSKHHTYESPEIRENRLVCAYSFAVSEQNASGATIVTAPTCGACGVAPAVLYYMMQKHNFDDNKIIDALATAGLIGNLIKQNASISGAECGCQAEIGSACSMAAAALGELFNLNLDQIEYAAEIALEHHLGLTCDPVFGLVQIPCIERNAVAAMRAINAYSLANFLTYSRKISFDMIVETMYETGKDISNNYRETSDGGLAKLYK